MKGEDAKAAPDDFLGLLSQLRDAHANLQARCFHLEAELVALRPPATSLWVGPMVPHRPVEPIYCHSEHAADVPLVDANMPRVDFCGDSDRADKAGGQHMGIRSSSAAWVNSPSSGGKSKSADTRQSRKSSIQGRLPRLLPAPPSETYAEARRQRVVNTVLQSSDSKKESDLLVVMEKHQVDTKRELAWDVLPTIVVIVNALCIGIGEINASGWSATLWDSLNILFGSFYLLEFIVKLVAMGPRKYFCGPQRFWGWFDFLCLLIVVLEILLEYGLDSANTGGAWALLRLLRLTRLAKLAHMLRFAVFDELKQMLNGVLFGSRVLLWSIVLFLTMIFIVGVVMTSTLGKDFEELSTLPRAMFTIFSCYLDSCTAYDGSPLQQRIFREVGPLFWIAYVIFSLFVTVCILNLIIAVFIDRVVCCSAQQRKLKIGTSQALVMAKLKRSLIKFMAGKKADGLCFSELELENASHAEVFDTFNRFLVQERKMSQIEFEEWLEQPDMIGLLQEAEVDSASKYDFFDVLDVDVKGSLGVDDLVNGLMSLRGPITKTDIMAIRLKMTYTTALVHDIWKAVMSGEQQICTSPRRTKYEKRNSRMLKPQRPLSSVEVGLVGAPSQSQTLERSLPGDTLSQRSDSREDVQDEKVVKSWNSEDTVKSWNLIGYLGADNWKTPEEVTKPPSGEAAELSV